MIALQSDVRVYLACGYTDMRKGMQGLAMLVQQVLSEDPFNGAFISSAWTSIPEAARACDWFSSIDDSEKYRFFAALQLKTIKIAVGAVRAAIAAEHKARNE